MINHIKRTSILFVCSLFVQINFAQNLYTASQEVKLMGCKFVIRCVGESDQLAWDAVNKGIDEITRIEKAISSWDPKSQTTLVNNAAGEQAIEVSGELYGLVSRAKKVSELTNGAFDISFASMDRIYTFDRSEKALPAEDVIKAAKSKINWQNIELNKANNSIFLKEKGMKIGFGAIGKGYAANRAKHVMSQMPGIHGGIINASGDLQIWGNTGEDSEGWNIKISDPKSPKNILADLNVENTAVVTSGNYEGYFMCQGKRYAHIIDPKTGLPTTGIKSVTIICPDAELADALATSVFVLGIDEGLYLINQLSQIEALIVTDEDELIHSENLKLNYQ